MRSYAEQCIFRAADVHAWRRANRVVLAMPDRPCSWEVRCHEVARVVHRVLTEGRFGLYDLVDGKYGAVDHSWLVCTGSRVSLGRHVVLDPYACGRVPQCQLVDTDVPGVAQAYRPGRRRGDIREADVAALYEGLPPELRAEA